MPNRSNCTANNNNNKITFTLPQIPNNNLFNLDSRDYLDNSRYMQELSRIYIEKGVFQFVKSGQKIVNKSQ